MKRKATWIMAALAAASILCTACGGSGSSSGTATQAAAPAAAESQAGDAATGTAAPAATAEADKYGGDLVMATYTPCNNLYGLVRQGNTYNFVFPAIEKLANIQPDRTYEPVLADSWERDNDAMTLTLHIHPGIQFSDGSDLTADVVKWNMEKMIENGLSTNLANPSGFDVVDDTTLVIHFDEFSLSWESSILNAMIYSQKEYEEFGQDYCMNNPIGTGPFILSDYQTDTYLYYTKNPNYWREGLPYLDSYKIMLLKDASTTQTAFMNGELQFFKAFTDEQVKYMEAQGFKSACSEGPTAWAYRWLAPTSTVEGDPFYKKEVRQAVFLYGIDWQAVANVCGGSIGEPSVQLTADGSAGYNPEVEEMSYYDPEKAKQMLADAGYPDGFSTKLILPNSSYNSLGTILQAEMQKIGVQAEVEINADYQRLKESGDYPGINMQDSPASIDRTDYVFRTYSPKARGSKYMNFSDEYMELFNQAKEARTMEERDAIMQKLYMQLHVEDCLIRGAYRTPTEFFISPKLKDSGLGETLYTPAITYLEK